MKSDVSTQDNRFRVTRVFNAPRPLVFSWWTTAEKYQQWSGCKEAIRCEVVMDFRVGGSFTQIMQIAAQGQTCDFTVTGTYQEIVEPETISYNAHLGTVPIRVKVEFFAEGRRTKVVITHEGFPDDFFGENVLRGTSESFDKLVPLLGTHAAEAVG